MPPNGRTSPLGGILLFSTSVPGRIKNSKYLISGVTFPCSHPCHPYKYLISWEFLSYATQFHSNPYLWVASFFPAKPCNTPSFVGRCGAFPGERACKSHLPFNLHTFRPLPFPPFSPFIWDYPHSLRIGFGIFSPNRPKYVTQSRIISGLHSPACFFMAFSFF